MAHEFYLQFTPPERYTEHLVEVRSAIEQLPSFARLVSGREIWLKASDSPGRWDYDLRIFLDPEKALVEVTTFGTAYSVDLRGLIALLSRTVKTELLDDDGEPVQWQ